MPFDDDKSPWGPTPLPYENDKWPLGRCVLAVIVLTIFGWLVIAMVATLVMKITGQ